MLKRLIAEQGWPVYDLARASGISANSIYRWMDEEVVPHIGNAVAIARVLRAPELLDHWGYDGAGNALSEELAETKTTHDIHEANGWRLDTLIAEIRELRKELRQRPTLIETSTVQRGEVLVLRANFGEELIDHVMEAVAHTDLQGRVLILDGDIEMAVIDKEESNE